MACLCFLLSYPTHLLSKNEGIETGQLVFNDAKIVPGFGELVVSYEIQSLEPAEKGASEWKTIDLSSDDAHNIVRLITGGTTPDQVVIEWPPRLHTCLLLSTESFSRLLNMNWKDQIVKLTLYTKLDAAIDGLKLSFDWKTMTGREVTMPIGNYTIEWDERPTSVTLEDNL